jgi:cytochrome oxidase Cu insertion factor (SCO1/SenC/PrrC family)
MPRGRVAYAPRVRPTGSRIALAGVASLALAAAAAGCGGGTQGAAGAGRTSTFEGAPLPAGIEAPAFTLTTPRGERVPLSSLRGSVVAVAFLDSRCAPGCVLVAQQIRGAIDELAHAPQVLIVSVDPRADTPASVAAFLRSVSLAGRVRYLTGPAGELARVWRAYRVTLPGAGRSRFEAALSVLLIDRTGAERVLFGIEQLAPEALAHDIRLLQGSSAG